VFRKTLVVLGLGFRPLLMQLFPPVDIHDADLFGNYASGTKAAIPRPPSIPEILKFPTL